MGLPNFFRRLPKTRNYADNEEQITPRVCTTTVICFYLALLPAFKLRVTVEEKLVRRYKKPEEFTRRILLLAHNSTNMRKSTGYFGCLSRKLRLKSVRRKSHN